MWLKDILGYRARNRPEPEEMISKIKESMLQQEADWTDVPDAGNTNGESLLIRLRRSPSAKTMNC